MKIKSIIIIALVGIIAFVLGVIFQNNVIIKKNKRIENQIIKILKEDNETLLSDKNLKIVKFNFNALNVNCDIFVFLIL
ncbi:MAG: hypothetical protein PHC83_09090 [Bacteroidales bacterium]|nr:hypothetical protein [Bacteroidales bacterium]MDD4209155.1 hypothetical protein [Bacteroidales bacterium]